MAAPRTAQTTTRPFLETGPTARAAEGSGDRTVALPAARRLHQPAGHREARLPSADGTGTRVHRGSVVDGARTRELTALRPPGRP